MNIRSRIGDRLFRRPQPAEASPEHKRISEFHGEYAGFCGAINPTAAAEWYRRGFDDFPRVLSTDGVRHVGIDWDARSLLILTERIAVQDKNGVWRDIGEIMVAFNPKEKSVTYENMTHLFSRQTAQYHHPHILNGTLCTSASSRIMNNFLDANVSDAMTSIVRCLRMRHGEIIRNTAYYDAEHWPELKSGGANER